MCISLNAYLPNKVLFAHARYSNIKLNAETMIFVYKDSKTDLSFIVSF